MMDEFSWIESLRSHLARDLVLPWGIGDDAAVLRPLAATRVIATDVLVEGVHFRRDWSSLEDIAFKLYASNASDMWAMGAAPSEWLLTVAWPQRPELSDAQALSRGFQDAMEMWGAAPLIGGDTSTSKGALMLSITMLGEVVGSPWRRGEFVPGDRLWVDGPLGLAAAGLAELQAFGAAAAADSGCVVQQRRPQRQPAETRFDARGAIDISDGLSVDLQHAAKASGVRMVLDQPLPGGPALEEAARRLNIANAQRVEAITQWQLHGGEDYVRVVGCAERPGDGWTSIGYVEAGAPSVFDERRGERQALPPRGWNHFRAETS